MAAFSDDHLLVLIDQALDKEDGLVAFILNALLLCIVDSFDLSQLAVFCAGGLGRDNHAIDILHIAMAVDHCLMVDMANEQNFSKDWLIARFDKAKISVVFLIHEKHSCQCRVSSVG